MIARGDSTSNTYNITKQCSNDTTATATYGISIALYNCRRSCKYYTYGSSGSANTACCDLYIRHQIYTPLVLA
eukprot:14753-Heterococcus_DN1.PRE.1